MKVKTGDKVKAGQVIGDRSVERQKLLYQKSQLQTDLSRLRIDSLYIPILPIAKLPEANYDIQQANLTLAEYALSEAKTEALLQEGKISQLKSIAKEDPDRVTNIDSILLHERSIAKQLASKLQKATLKLDLAKANLAASKQDRKYKEYLHQLEIYKRSVNLSRQKLELARQEEKVDYQRSQINSQISQIDTQILQLTEVRSPYDGTIKKIKWAGQSDNIINVVVTLSVESNSSE